MSTTLSEAIITSCEPLNERVLGMHVNLGSHRFKYQPGQYVAVDLGSGNNETPDWKYYSIASAPNGHNGFDLCISSENLSDLDLKGKTVKVKGPAGVFTLPAVIDKDLVFIATGTGVAPFRGMIQHIFDNKIPHRGIHLIHGCRNENEVLYKEEFEELERTNPLFKYDIILSRTEGQQWAGKKGRVRDWYLEEYQSPRPDVLFYLCGWPDMVKDGIRDLVETIGYHPHQLVYELFY